MKKLLAAMLVAVLPLAAHAFNTEIDGIAYDVSNNTAKVIGKDPEYTGDVVIPASIVVDEVEYPVKVIWQNAFVGCTGLTSVKLPESITTIQPGTFKDCTSLLTVNIPPLIKIIGTGLFEGCTAMTTFTIPEGVTTINAEAFKGCTSLTSVSIPSTVTKIKNSAFGGCTSLTEVHISDLTQWCNISKESQIFEFGYSLYVDGQKITDLVIPEGITTINAEAFKGCTSLTSVSIPSTVKTLKNGAFEGCSALAEVHVLDLAQWLTIKKEYQVFDSGYSLYVDGQKITDLVIPDGLTSIPSSLFYYCSSLESISIPESVTTIGSYAFSGCSSLKSIFIPPSVTYIENDAFADCTDLTAVHISDLDAWIKAKRGNVNSCPLLYAHHLYLNGEKVTEVVYPEGTTSVDMEFAGCTDLTSVTFPSTLTYIGPRCFEGCPGLTSVTIPSAVTIIGFRAFEGCTGLTAVHISDLDAWMRIRFSNYSNNDDGCNPLQYAHHLYLNGEEVTEAVFPEDLREISAFAFTGCTGLTCVKIPKSVERIGERAFAGCTSLEKVYCFGPIPPRWTSSDAFEGAEGTTLYCPNIGTLSDYSRKAPWINFANAIMVVRLTYQYKRIDNSGYWEIYKEIYYVPGDPVTPEPEPTKEGYTFSGWSEIPETMPEHNVTVEGMFTINQYLITYVVDGETFATQEVDFGSVITPPEMPERDGSTCTWGEYPETMPAHDITIEGTYATGIESLSTPVGESRIYNLSGQRLSLPQRGVNIINGKKVVVK